MNKVADIPVNIGLKVAAVKDLPVGKTAADESGHRAFPDTLINFPHIGWCVCAGSLFSALSSIVKGEENPLP